jgi:hypothetical protein
MRGDGDGAPLGGEADDGGGFLEGDTVEDGAAARQRRLAYSQPVALVVR